MVNVVSFELTNEALILLDSETSTNIENIPCSGDDNYYSENERILREVTIYEQQSILSQKNQGKSLTGLD